MKISVRVLPDGFIAIDEGDIDDVAAERYSMYFPPRRTGMMFIRNDEHTNSASLALPKNWIAV